MAEYDLKDELRFEAHALADAFRLGHVKVKRRLRGILRDGHFGSFVGLAKLDDDGEIQLWFDRASGHERPLFWCGIFYKKEVGLDSAIQKASLKARPKLTLTPKDMQQVAEGGLMPKEAIPLDLMNSTIAERLDQDNYTPEYYIGRYFFSYSAEQALVYLRSLQGEDIEEDGFWEGEVQQRMTTFYERNVHARNACIKKYGYICVVCKIDFYKKYGEVGQDFIHVHHTTPLASRTRKSLTRASELVTVCPNCHAMLHRGSLKTPETLRMMLEKAIEKGDRSL